MTIADKLKPGAVVRTNYNTGPYTVEEVHCKGNAVSLICKGGYYLNGFVIEGERIVKATPWLPGSTGYHSNGGGLNGDGRDEVFIVESPVLGVEITPLPSARSGRKAKADTGQLSLFGGEGK